MRRIPLKGKVRGGWLIGAVLAAALVPTMAVSAPKDEANLKLTKSGSPDPVAVGSPLTYTIKVENLGPAPATGVTMTDTLPHSVDFVSASQGCTLQGRRVTCNVGQLAATGGGARETVEIVVRPTESGTLSNTARTDSDERDPVPANNSDNEETTVRPKAPPACRGVTATIKGTAGDDQLTGTDGADVIVAFGGNDLIAARAGRDLICAGRGNDVVRGGSAADRVFGGGGADRLLGRGGPDLLKGNRGNDALRGNRGNDRLRGGPGSDLCRGGPGMDSRRSCER